MNISVILRYADVDVEPLDELDADELGEKLLSSMPYLPLPVWPAGCGGFSSPAGLSRRSIVSMLNVSAVVVAAESEPDSDALVADAVLVVSSTSHVSRRMRSSSELSVRCCFFLQGVVEWR